MQKKLSRLTLNPLHKQGGNVSISLQSNLPKGNWYVFGFCHRHQKFMVYSLSRMKDLIILDEFNFIEDFEKHIHIDPNIGIWNNDVEPIKIELLFSKEINTNILERT